MSTSHREASQDRTNESANNANFAAPEMAEGISETVMLVRVEYQKYLDKRNAIRKETTRLRRSTLGVQLS